MPGAVLAMFGSEVAVSPVSPQPLLLWSWIDLGCAIVLTLEALLLVVLLRSVPLIARIGVSILPFATAIWAWLLWHFAADAYYWDDIFLHGPPGHAAPPYRAYNARFLQALRLVVWQSVLILAIVVIFLVVDVWLLCRRERTSRASISTAGISPVEPASM